MNPFSSLTDKEREMFTRFISILNKGSKGEVQVREEDMSFITNNAQPMVDALMKSIAKWASEYGVKEEEIGSVLLLLSKISHIAGGINFADFTVTEVMAKEMK